MDQKHVVLSLVHTGAHVAQYMAQRIAATRFSCYVLLTSVAQESCSVGHFRNTMQATVADKLSSREACRHLLIPYRLFHPWLMIITLLHKIPSCSVPSILCGFLSTVPHQARYSVDKLSLLQHYTQQKLFHTLRDANPCVH